MSRRLDRQKALGIAPMIVGLTVFLAIAVVPELFWGSAASEAATPPGQLTRRSLAGNVVAISGSSVTVGTNHGNVLVNISGETAIASGSDKDLGADAISEGDFIVVHLDRSPLEKPPKGEDDGTATSTAEVTPTAAPDTAVTGPQATSTDDTTVTPEATSTPEVTPTATPEATSTPVATPTATATATPSPTATATPEATSTAEITPTATSEATSTPVTTATTTPEATSTTVAAPTAIPTAQVSEAELPPFREVTALSIHVSPKPRR